MPIVTSQPARAASTAMAPRRRKASVSVMTWSAAKEPITASGSRASSRAAARPIAAIESRGRRFGDDGVRAELRQLGDHRVPVRLRR